MASEADLRPVAAANGGHLIAVNHSSSSQPLFSSSPPSSSSSDYHYRRPRPADSGPAAAAVQRAWALLNGSDDDDDDDEDGTTHPIAAAGAAARPSLFDEGRDAGGQSSRVASPITSPPYWSNPHARTPSSTSIESVLPLGAITLRDNEHDDGPDGFGVFGRDRNKACWAKSVEVDDFTVVNGSATNIGAFVVWHIKVVIENGSFMVIRKRYSEFVDLRERLIEAFPDFEAAVPELPPKSVISKFRPRFLERRRSGLQYFLK